MTSESHIQIGDICIYEIKLPDEAQPGDGIELSVIAQESVDLMFASGETIATASSLTQKDPMPVHALIVNPSSNANSWGSVEKAEEPIVNPDLDASKWASVPSDQNFTENANSTSVPVVHLEPNIDPAYVSMEIVYPNNIYMTMVHVQ